jgi:ureidoacrylate peracid hydrolase
MSYQSKVLPAPLSLTELVSPAKTALIVVDVQNDFCGSQGACATVGDNLGSVPGMLTRLIALLKSAREVGLTIVFVQAKYDAVYMSNPWVEQLHHKRGFHDGICLSNTTGIDFVSGTGPEPNAKNEIVVIKHRYSAFWGTDIDAILRSRAIENVIISGIATEGCPESTARDAFFRDYRIVAVDDCLGSFDPPAHSASIKVLAKLFGHSASSSEIIRIWSTQKRATHQTTTINTDQTIDLTTKETAVVVVNAQNDIVNPSGLCFNNGLKIDSSSDTLHQIRDTLSEFRRRGQMVIQLMMLTNPNFLGAGSPVIDTANSKLSVKSLCKPSDTALYCVENTWGAHIADSIQDPADVLVHTRRVSGFADTSLDMILRSNGIKNVLLMGYPASGLIDVTAREASSRDYGVFICAGAISDFRVGTSTSMDPIAALTANFPSATILK